MSSLFSAGGGSLFGGGSGGRFPQPGVPLPGFERKQEESGGGILDFITPDWMPGWMQAVVKYNPAVLGPTIGARTAKGLGEAVLGIPTALGMVARGEFGALKDGIIQGYKEDYGMLADGDILGFLEHVYNNPTGPLLDAAGLVTFGAGTAVKGAALVGKAGARAGRTGGIAGRAQAFAEAQHAPRTVFIQTKAQRAQGIPGKEVALPIQPNPVKRAAGNAMRSVVQVSDRAPVVGNFARLKRAEIQERSRAHGAMIGQGLRWTEAAKRVGPEEDRVTMNLMSRGINPDVYLQELKAAKAAGAKIDDNQIRVLEDGKVRARYDEIREARRNGKHRDDDALKKMDEDSRNLHVALNEGHLMGSRMERWLQGIGYDVEGLAARPFLAMRLLDGEDFNGTAIRRARHNRIDDEIKNVKNEINVASKSAATDRKFGISRRVKRSKTRDALATMHEGRRELRRQWGAINDLEDAVIGATSRGDDIVPSTVMSQGTLQDILPDYLNVQLDEVADITRDQALGALYHKRLQVSRELDMDTAKTLGELKELQKGARGRARAAEMRGDSATEAAALRELEELLRREQGVLANHTTLSAQNFDRRVRIAEEMGSSKGKRLREYRQEILDGALEEPFYMPDDVAAAFPGAVNNFAPTRGLNLLMGKIALGDDVLTPAYMKVVKKIADHEMWQRLESQAVVVTPTMIRNGDVPSGHVYLRPVDHAGATRTAKEIAGQDNAEDLARRLDEADGKLDERVEYFGPDTDDPTFRPNPDFEEGLATRGDSYLVVPKKVANEMRRQQNAATRVSESVLKRPMWVWRSIVLGTRPAFFVNNLVGNTFLHAMQFAGRGGIMNLLRTVSRTRGIREAAKFFGGDEFRDAAGRTWIDSIEYEFFGDHVVGTRGMEITGDFVGDFRRTREANIKWADRKYKRILGHILDAPLKNIRFTARVTEGAIRRAEIETIIRSNPKIQRMVRQMNDDPRKWEKVTRKAFENDPKLVESISREVNLSLGNYLAFSAAEREYLRNFMPFYSWLRAITTIGLRMPIAHTGRTAILNRVGEAGNEYLLEKYGEMPSFLMGGVPIPDWMVNIIGGESQVGDRAALWQTQSINPLASFEQVIAAAGGFVNGDRQGVKDLISQGNPLIQSAYQMATGRHLLTEQEIGSGIGPVTNTFARGLPPGQLAAQFLDPDEPSETKLFEKSRRERLGAQAGFSVKFVNPDTAEFLAELEEQGAR